MSSKVPSDTKTTFDSNHPLEYPTVLAALRGESNWALGRFSGCGALISIGSVRDTIDTNDMFPMLTCVSNDKCSNNHQCTAIELTQDITKDGAVLSTIRYIEKESKNEENGKPVVLFTNYLDEGKISRLHQIRMNAIRAEG